MWTLCGRQQRLAREIDRRRAAGLQNVRVVEREGVGHRSARASVSSVPSKSRSARCAREIEEDRVAVGLAAASARSGRARGMRLDASAVASTTTVPATFSPASVPASSLKSKVSIARFAPAVAQQVAAAAGAELARGAARDREVRRQRDEGLRDLGELRDVEALRASRRRASPCRGLSTSSRPRAARDREVVEVEAQDPSAPPLGVESACPARRGSRARRRGDRGRSAAASPVMRRSGQSSANFESGPVAASPRTRAARMRTLPAAGRGRRDLELEPVDREPVELELPELDADRAARQCATGARAPRRAQAARTVASATCSSGRQYAAKFFQRFQALPVFRATCRLRRRPTDYWMS